MFCQSTLFAQEDAWVYFTDKENVSTSIANPLSILSQESINRKNAHDIAIDVRDVPVNENYILQLKSQIGITVKAKSKWFNAVHVRGAEVDILALELLNFVDRIDFANRSLNTSGREFVQQNKLELVESLTDFNYGMTQNQVEMIHIEELHALDFTGEGIVIAVIDAGFPNVNTMNAFQQLRDTGKLLNGYDFVDRNPNIYAYTGNTHGTKVLSTMAAFLPNSYVGTAPNASYYLFRSEDAASENPVEESYWVEAAERADSLGVHIINSSLGYNRFDNSNYNYLPTDMNGMSTYISRGANIAAEKGILVVNSAGNTGSSDWQIVTAPADAPGVFTIGGVDSDGIYAAFSSQGSAIQPTQKPDVVARAQSAFVVNENDEIITNSGTSFSSPIIAGAVACLMQALPDLTIDQIKQYIRQSSSQFSTPDNLLGFGIPDFGLALSNALSIPENEFQKIKLYPNPVKGSLFLQLPSSFEIVDAAIFDITGKLILQKTMTNSLETMDMSFLASGLYFLNLQVNDSKFTYKLIKQ